MGHQKGKTDNPYRKIVHDDGRLYGKYKTYPDSQIPIEDLQAALEGRQLSTGHTPKFVKPVRDKSFLAFTYHIGSRKLEPAGIHKEDLVVTATHVVVKVPAFKSGERADVLQLPLNRPGVDLIIQQWQKTKKDRQIWPLSGSTAYRIIVRALGKCPHWLRHNWITTMQQRLDGPPSDVDRKIMSWTGIKRRETLDHYRMKMKKDIGDVSDVLL